MFFNRRLRRQMMTLFSRVEVLEAAKVTDEAAIAALQAAPATGVTADQLAALQTQVDGIRADVGTPAA